MSCDNQLSYSDDPLLEYYFIDKIITELACYIFEGDCNRIKI